jgi:hypothetical protein
VIDEVFARAERDWREIVERAYPLTAGIPVVVKRDPKAPTPFESYTDNRTITVGLHQPSQLERDFARFAVPERGEGHRLYGLAAGAADAAIAGEVPYDVFLLVLFHELFHPLVCPNSREDERAISQAIYRGVIAAEPALAPKDAVFKVDHVKNLVWDVVVNVTFLARSRSVRRDILRSRIGDVFRENARAIAGQPVVDFPKGMLPVVYLMSAGRGTTDKLIALAGLFYATLSYGDPFNRERAIRAFLDDLARKGMDESTAASHLAAMYAGIACGEDGPEFVKRADLALDARNPSYESNQEWLLRALDAIFDAYATRYASLEGLAKALAPLIPLTEKQGSPDAGTTGWDESPADAGADEQAACSLGRTIGDLEGELGAGGVEKVLGEMAGDPQPGGGGLGSQTAGAIATFARDELLKRTAEPIDIRGPAMGNELLDIGRQVRWELKRSHDITSGDLASLDLPRIVQAQVASGLPILMQLADDRYKLNEFELVETPVRGWAPRRLETHLPENWVLLLDSSGSMCGAPFELVLRVTYGIKKGLHELCTAKKKDLKFGVVNFSSSTVYSGLDSFTKIYTSRTHRTKQVLFEQQNGGTTLDVAVFAQIAKDLARGRTVYTLITDGEISNGDAVFAAVEKAARARDTAFLFVEISTRSELGKKIDALSKKLPSVIYRKVDRVEDIRGSLQSLLIRYVPV